MHGGKIAAIGECRRNLLRRRRGGIEHSRLDPGPQPGKNCLHVVNRWIDEKDFRDVRHSLLPHARRVSGRSALALECWNFCRRRI